MEPHGTPWGRARGADMEQHSRAEEEVGIWEGHIGGGIRRPMECGAAWTPKAPWPSSNSLPLVAQSLGPIGPPTEGHCGPPSPSGCMRMLNKYVKASNFLELARSQLLLTTTCLNLEGVRRRRSFFCTKAQEEFCTDGPCYLHEDLWPLWRWRARSCSRASVDGKRCR